MFQHQCAILRGFIKKKDYKYNLYLGASRTCHFYIFGSDMEAHVRGVADKSLAPPGRKQTTTTKLGIFSTYSPKSSIPFLALYSNFCKPLKKKKFRKVSVQQGLHGSNDLRVERKMANFQLFQSREQVVVRQG